MKTRIIRPLAGLCLGALLAFNAAAQNYPNRPIRIIVGYVAGGGADILARLVSPKLTEQLGQPVVVENRPGGGTSISIERVAASSPDGYTLLIMNAAGTALPSLRRNLGYQLERDLAPISLMTTGPYLLVVNASSPLHSVGDVINAARARPGTLSYGSSGAGTSPHLMGELFNMLAKVKITHVPYKGGAQSSVAVASNEIDMSYPSIPVALPLMASNRVRAIGITTAKRASFLPDIPTISESGLAGYDLSVWYGMLVPAGLPKNIVSRLNAVMVKTMNLPDIKEPLAKLGMDAASSTPEQFAAFLREEVEKNAKLIKFAGIKAD